LRAGLRLFFEHFLEHALVEAQVSDQSLKRHVLLLQLLQPPQLAHAETGILLFPTKIGLLGDAKLAADVADLGSRFDLTKRVDDLFLAGSSPWHGWTWI
jgi:hypothetical protein